MISAKVFPCYYLIDVSGEAVNALIPGDYKIQRITVGSKHFTNDMYAMAALQEAIMTITMIVNPAEPVEKIDYNPEFFPTLKPIELTEQQKRHQEEMQRKAAEMTEKLSDKQQFAVPLSTIFDPAGDFVETRWTVTAKDKKMRIQGKIAADVNEYLMEKMREYTMQKTDIATVH